MLVFGVLVALVFNFAFEMDSDTAQTAAGGVVWVTLVFSAMLGFQRSFASEQDRNTLDGLILAPVSRFAVFMAKMLMNWIFVLITALVVLPAYSLLANLSLLQPGLWLVVGLGTLGFCVAGTLIAALASYSRAREVLLPVLLLPVGVPLLLAAVRLSNGILQGMAMSEMTSWLLILIGFDIIMLVAAWLLADGLLGE